VQTSNTLRWWHSGKRRKISESLGTQSGQPDIFSSMWTFFLRQLLAFLSSNSAECHPHFETWNGNDTVFLHPEADSHSKTRPVKGLGRHPRYISLARDFDEHCLDRPYRVIGRNPGAGEHRGGSLKTIDVPCRTEELRGAVTIGFLRRRFLFLRTTLLRRELTHVWLSGGSVLFRRVPDEEEMEWYAGQYLKATSL
jgi:hypothetical protein